MAKQVINTNAPDGVLINVGRTANDRSGDSLRLAFTKTNDAFDRIDANFTELYSAIGADVQIPIQTNNNGKYLTTNGTILSWAEIQGSGVSIADFGEGFSLTSANKIVTNKLYSTNLTQSTQHYRLELDTNGVVHLPDQSIINGATLKSVAGNYAGITAGPVGKDEDSWMWVDSSGAWIATDYSNNAFTWKFDNNGTLTLPVGGSIIGAGAVASGISVSIASDFQDQLDVSGTAINVTNSVENQQIVEGWTIVFNDGTTRVANANTGNTGPGGEYIISYDTPYSSLTGFPIVAYGLDYTAGSPAVINLTAGSTNWEFKTDGSLTFPDSSVQTTAFTGGLVSPNDIYHLNINNYGIESDSPIKWVEGSTERVVLNYSPENHYFVISTNRAGAGKNWTFEDNGDTTMPRDGSTLLNYGHLYFGDYAAGTNMFVDEGFNLQIYTNTGGQRSGNWIFGTNGKLTFPGGGAIDIKGSAPTHSYGVAGDKTGAMYFDGDYIYYCKQDYVDNFTNIWVRTAWTGTNW